MSTSNALVDINQMVEDMFQFTNSNNGVALPLSLINNDNFISIKLITN